MLSPSFVVPGYCSDNSVGVQYIEPLHLFDVILFAEIRRLLFCLFHPEMEGKFSNHLPVEIDLEEIRSRLGKHHLVHVSFYIGSLCLIVQSKVHLGRLNHNHSPLGIEHFDLLYMKPFSLGPGGEYTELRIGDGEFCHEDV